MSCSTTKDVVVDTTITGRDGRYRFTSFAETGDYQVRVVLPTRFAAAKPARDVLISRGGLTIGGMNFAPHTCGPNPFLGRGGHFADDVGKRHRCRVNSDEHRQSLPKISARYARE